MPPQGPPMQMQQGPPVDMGPMPPTGGMAMPSNIPPEILAQLLAFWRTFGKHTRTYVTVLR
jgi:hypothetical protein